MFYGIIRHIGFLLVTYYIIKGGIYMTSSITAIQNNPNIQQPQQQTQSQSDIQQARSERLEELNVKQARTKENVEAKAAELKETNKVMGMDMKLKAGKDLSEEEMTYLKTNSPDLYRDAYEVKKEKVALQVQMSSATTKEAVTNVADKKFQELGSQAQTISNDTNISKSEKVQKLEQVSRVFSGASSEYTSFTSTSKYEALPQTTKTSAKADVQPIIDLIQKEYDTSSEPFAKYQPMPEASSYSAQA